MVSFLSSFKTLAVLCRYRGGDACLRQEKSCRQRNLCSQNSNLKNWRKTGSYPYRFKSKKFSGSGSAKNMSRLPFNGRNNKIGNQKGPGGWISKMGKSRRRFLSKFTWENEKTLPKCRSDRGQGQIEPILNFKGQCMLISIT